MNERSHQLSSGALKQCRVLGTSLEVCDYHSAFERVKQLAHRDGPSSVSASNTHTVSLARARKDYREVLHSFNMVLPDGMPLVWAMRLKGASINDRVYGPYFMRYVLKNAPRPWKHFFFGGKQETLDRLVSTSLELQPDLNVVGTYSPPFRKWAEEDQEEFARIIQEHDPDFIWIALGGDRQERWISQNLQRYSRGVFFAVGDAFELLAGNRPFAPEWMQRNGLTWAYRLSQEPRRLLLRYAKFNSLFLYYYFRDLVLGEPSELDLSHVESVSEVLPKVAFLGSRGVPARYSGFETVVEQVGWRLVERGYTVRVYNRLPHLKEELSTYRGMKVVILPTIPNKFLDTIIHTMLSMFHVLFSRVDIIYLCGVGNALLASVARLRGIRVVINVDGADYQRRKWGWFARLWLKQSERWATKMGDVVIADNHEIVKRYEKDYGYRPVFLSYGTNLIEQFPPGEELKRWGLESQKYLLYVSRLTPENDADLLLRAYRKYKGKMPLVIVGSPGYESVYYEELKELADDRVIFTGSRFGDAYRELSTNAAVFIMPAVIEATRLVLLDQLGMGVPIIYRDCPATREVLDNAGKAFADLEGEGKEDALAELIEYLEGSPEELNTLSQLSRERAEKAFDWSGVVSDYEEIFRKVMKL